MHSKRTKKIDYSLYSGGSIIHPLINSNTPLGKDKYMDIFEQLKGALNCEYISDLKFPPYSKMAKSLLRMWNLNVYSLKELNDLANYLYKSVSFESKEAAIYFFKQEVSDESHNT